MPKILYEDTHLLLIEKPMGVPSQDGEGDSIPNRLAQQGYAVKVAHRLDKPTGGVMVYARTDKAAAKLSALVGQHQLFVKEYLAVVEEKKSLELGIWAQRIEKIENFAKEGEKIVCGGTTSTIVARYLGKELIPTLDYPDPEIPPISEIEGVDLVTEGVVTISKVLTYAQNYLDGTDLTAAWSGKTDGASLIAQELFEKATDINFFVGKAINPAHQNPDLPITFGIKIQLIEGLAKALEQMGKQIKVSYF